MGLFDFFSGKGRRDRFAKRVMSRLAETGWPHPISYDAQSFALELGGEAGTVALHRTFHEWSRDPERQHVATLDAAIAFIHDLGPPPVFEEARAMLRPAIRARAGFARLVVDPGDSKAAGFNEAWRPLGANLAVFVAIDRPHSLNLIHGDTFRAWDQSFTACLEIAIENMRKAGPLRFERHSLGFDIAVSDDQNEAARLLAPELFSAWEGKGDPVVIAATRHGMFAAGSEDLEGLEVMAAYAANFLAEEGWPLSYEPMVLRAGRWEPFEPPSGLTRLADLSVLQRVFDYAEERPFLAYGPSGEARPIADIIVFPTEEGLQSLALWVEPVCLLPHADYVVLRPRKGQILVRSWRDVQAICGLADAPGRASPYSSTAVWPDAAAMAAIAASPEPNWTKGRGVGVANGRLTLFG